MVKTGFASKIFKVEQVEMGGTTESIVRGGRDKFSLLRKALAGINQIGVIGWGSQAPAQAQNLRDSLKGLPIRVVIGLQGGSKSIPKAEAAGFTKESGTLGEMFGIISKSDLVILLISDAAQVEHYPIIFEKMKPGAILGLSHGFLVGYLDNTHEHFPQKISVIGICPKGMGPSVRRLYEQGKTINGAGINCSFAVEQDNTIGQRATDIALGWGIAIGAPFVFQTTLKQEYLSDLVGERSVLLAAIWGILEANYRDLVMDGVNEESTFRDTAENVTGLLSPIISAEGLIGVYNRLTNRSDKDVFERIFSAAYWPFYTLVEEIYQEVESGNEIESVIMAGRRMERFPMEKIGNTSMWVVGEEVRKKRKNYPIEINPRMAGLYCAAMMAQIDILLEKGHCLSEICNESVIEAVDSLNPYMHFKGVDYMVDNCSTTARIGTRKWGPRWDYVTQRALIDSAYGKIDSALIEAFLKHQIHDALAVCATMRPTVSISIQG